jgi:hypothetical protein
LTEEQVDEKSVLLIARDVLSRSAALISQGVVAGGTSLTTGSLPAVLSVLGSLHTKSGVPIKRPSDLPLDSTTGINTRRRIDDEGEGGENCEFPSTDLRARDIADGALPSAVVHTGTPFDEINSKKGQTPQGPYGGHDAVRSAHWKKGQTPRDRTVGTTQSGPPLPGRYVLP